MSAYFQTDILCLQDRWNQGETVVKTIDNRCHSEILKEILCRSKTAK